MNRQKEYTEEGRYTPISKVSEGGQSKTPKAVWRSVAQSNLRVDLKVTDIDGVGTVYTNDDTLYDEAFISITYGEEEPTDLSSCVISTQLRGGSLFWLDEFDGGEGIYPLYLVAVGDI